jgi:alkanesulfonate monooxygenase SsuD/methylene tetrahydromethanopterin reductase-like flavin-dependent oxidoreductase (luciferase family)
MHVGYCTFFQNPHDDVTDFEVYRNEVRFAEMAEPLGFDSVWSVEHHFDGYTMCPDVLQFLTYMAGRTRHIKLGSMVVVLPWHDPIRVAEQVSVLDHLSGGRFILGVGRGFARHEFEGFGTDQVKGREAFSEYAQLLIGALETGTMEPCVSRGQPRRDVRPFPARSFRGRIYAASVSPDSVHLMAKLGVGLLIVPQKPWSMIQADFEAYHKTWREVNGTQPPQPLSQVFVMVDENKERAAEKARRYIGAYYHSAIRHYEMDSDRFGRQQGYEFYDRVSQHINKRGAEAAAQDYVNLQAWGTPEQVLERLYHIKNLVNLKAMMAALSFGGMPYDEVERNITCFAQHVLPEVKKWECPDFEEPATLPPPRPADAASK